MKYRWQSIRLGRVGDHAPNDALPPAPTANEIKWERLNLRQIPTKGSMTTTNDSLSTVKTAGATQGWTLASANWLSAVATAVLAPVLPKIALYFHADPHVAVMISLVATLPALFVALVAWPAGLLADRFGTRLVLLFGVGIYGFVGCAPMVLNSLLAIVITRAGVGITEAIIMTCTTALVADYFHGSERERWLAVQTGGGGIVAVAMIALGGILGQNSWRVPFTMYGIAFILFPLCLFKTWEPARHEPVKDASVQQVEEKYNWAPLAWISLLSFFASTSFYIMIIQLSFILAERGVTDAKTVGLGCAGAVLFMPLGSVLFKMVRLPLAGKLTVSFGLSAVGFFVLALSHSFLFTEVGAAINGLGSGMVLPTLINWALSKLTVPVRARGTGIWQTCFFLGQFVSPLVILGLKNAFGSLGHAVLVYAVFMTVAAVVATVAFLRAGVQSSAEAE
jgi:MFS family permease